MNQLRAERSQLILPSDNQVDTGADAVFQITEDVKEDKLIDETMDGKRYMYFFVIFKSRDDRTPSDLYGTTEYCGYFFKDANAANLCRGTNISYMAKLLE